MKLKKILSAFLMLALVVTSLYPVQFVDAATTTAQNDGLNFDTTTSTDYDYYFTDEKLSQLPATFEATFRIPETKLGQMSRAGTILGNAIINEGDTSTDQSGNFNFGIINGMCPYIWVADATNTAGTVYSFGTSNGKDINGAKLITGEWIHLAIVNDVTANQVHCYLNGELWETLDGAYSGSWSMSSNWLRLGGDNRKGNTQNFKGDIKSVAIYADARTATEVASDYTNGVFGSEENLMAAYNLALNADGVYPTILEDLSPNNFDLQKEWIVESEAKSLSERQDYDYSMAIIGDPQIVTAHAQTVTSDSTKANARRSADSDDKIFQWIVDNKESKNIQFAFNLGDLNDSNAQWESGLAAMQILDGEVPYSVVRGNHDHVTEYIANITYDDYKDRIEGSFDGTTMLNTYQKFEVQGHKYMVVNLDFGVGGDDANDADAVLAWANQLVEANPDHQVIVTTHAYQASDGTRLAPGKSGAASTAKSGYYRAKDGEDIWDEFVSLHENIIMVLSGHVGSRTIVKTESIGVNGNKVVELMVNPQEMDKRLYDSNYLMGGMVAMLYFSNDGKDVSVEWYSTLRDQYYTVESQFSFDTTTIVGENGEVSLGYSSVDTTGSVPVAKVSEYKDYLFAGWYLDASCSLDKAIATPTDNCYAKFIPSEILGVKAQVSTSKLTEGSNAGDWAMRFISSVDSLNYKNVGFKVSYDEGGQIKTKTSSTKTVYERIKSSESEMDYSFSTGVISEYSEYFITGKLAIADTEAAKATEYTVQAYVETLDGTIVYGPKRVVCLNDSTGDTINMTVQANKQLSTSGTYTAKYGILGSENTATNVAVLSSDADGNTNLRITVPGGVSSMPSATKFAIYDASGLVAVAIYRNYYTTHETGDVSNPNKDTSWYHVDTTQDVFTIASSADLYGLAKLVTDDGIFFQGKTVTLIRDVVVNKGTATKDGFNVESGELKYNWNRIGKQVSSSAFQGTFDGQGHTVSGISLVGSAAYQGFFGAAGDYSTIRNLKITNSYIAGSGDFVGSIAGFAGSATLENLYSDAIVSASGSSDKYAVGGLVGRYRTATSGSTELRTVKNCWYAGEMYVSGAVHRVGGLIGELWWGANYKLQDCLYTGTVDSTSTGTVFGGLVGRNSTSAVIVMENCLQAGTINFASSCSTTNAGLIAGTLSCESGTKFSNVYTLSQFTHGTTAVTAEFGAITSGYATDTYTRSIEQLKVSKETELLELFPVLQGQSESAWMCYTDDAGNALGTPILKEFADLWLEKQ